MTAVDVDLLQLIAQHGDQDVDGRVAVPVQDLRGLLIDYQVSRQLQTECELELRRQRDRWLHIDPAPPGSLRILRDLTAWVTDTSAPPGEHWDGCERQHVWCLATSVRLSLIDWEREP